MTNYDRLLLEMGNRLYYTQEQYNYLLSENGLTGTDTFNKDNNMLGMLQTVLAILNSLSNNIDYFRSIETEFTTTSSAYSNLKDRIQEIENRISCLPTFEPASSQVTYLYHN